MKIKVSYGSSTFIPKIKRPKQPTRLPMGDCEAFLIANNIMPGYLFNLHVRGGEDVIALQALRRCGYCG